MNDNETTNYISKEKTAVEWLVEVFDLEMFDTFHLDKINQAKQMEKEQIVEFWNLGYQHGAHDSGRSGETHYEFKYGKND